MEFNHTKSFIGAIVEKIRRFADSGERERIRNKATKHYWGLKTDLLKDQNQSEFVIVTTWQVNYERASSDWK